MKKEKSRSLRFKIEIKLENEEGFDQFGRLIRAIYDAGFQSTARRMVGMLIREAEKKDVEVPPEIKAFAEQIVQ